MKLYRLVFALVPSHLLTELGVTWGPAQIAVTVLALIGVVAGGVTGTAKFARWSAARLRLRERDTRARVRRRQLFASYVEGRVRDLNRREEWSDYRFAELEAEVETIGDSRSRFELARLLGRSRGLRREKSLSKALMLSRERLILMRGDPGSGKSVALRYVARRMALEALDANRLDSVIPLYINLKDFRRGDRDVNSGLIEDFVLETLRRGGDREVDNFLADEFASGMAAGGWFFLFDSFDEIPEVLSSTEDDAVVQSYSHAISEFVEGMHACRGVIASRHFRAPQQQGLPTFRIVPLSESRKLDLLAKADLGDLEPQLVDDLQSLGPELAALSGNPLFLGLLVEYVRDHRGLPEGWHDVFESFVSRRLRTDRDRVQKLFGVSDDVLRLRSEEIAFTMTNAGSFGLSPSKVDLAQAYAEAGFTGRADLDRTLAALAWIKLGRKDEEVARPEEETFTFAHRRFQEYFATCVVLREPDRIDPRTLLTDARWRETAVTLFHAQPRSTAALVDEAEAILRRSVPAQVEEREDYRWPPGVLHLLGLLQSAFAGRANLLTDSLRSRIGSILADADARGSLTDRKWALEVAGTLHGDELAKFLLKAFRGRSNWLREVAFRQVARLGRIPPEISIEIRRSLLEKLGSGELRREWPSIRAQIMRLRPQTPFLRTARLLRALPVIDIAVFGVGYLLVAMTFRPTASYLAAWALVAVFGHLTLYLLALRTARLGGLFRGVRGDLATRASDLSLVAIFLSPFALMMRPLVALIPVGLAIAPGVAVVLTFGVVPVGYSTHDVSVVWTLIWAYAASWSIASLSICLRESPGPLMWPAIPLRWLAECAQSVRRAGLTATVMATVRFLATMTLPVAIIALLFSTLPSPYPEIIGYILMVAGLAIPAALVAYIIWQWFADLRSRRAWLHQSRRGMTAPDFLQCIAELKGSDNACRALQEIRARQLLKDAEDGAEVVRDLLSAVEGTTGPPKVWRSPAFVAWLAESGESELAGLTRFRDRVPDELGQLLEELERGNEVPVA